MPKYRYVGSHADFVQKGDTSTPVAPGDFIELSETEADKQENLIPVETADTEKAKGGKSA